MAAYFLDSSALVKRYAAETGTAWVKGLIDPAAGTLVLVARITGVETVAALARKRKGDLLSPADAATAEEEQISSHLRKVLNIHGHGFHYAVVRRGEELSDEKKIPWIL